MHKKKLYIKNSSLHIEQFKRKFSKRKSFSVSEIFSFYKEHDPFIKKSTVNWRIYTLVKENIIQRTGRGIYSLGEQRNFIPEISSQLKKIFNAVNNEFPYLTKSVWTTEWLTNLMLHIPYNHFIVLEVEKGSEENVFYFLSENFKNVFINPSESILNRYSDTQKKIIIVKNLISLSPIQKINDVYIPNIEKIIVDLIIEKELYNMFQGRDLEIIIKELFNKYSINLNRLYNYADRRKKSTLVKNRITKFSLDDISR